MVVLNPIDADDSGLTAALQYEGLPAPGAWRYFSATEAGSLAGYVGLEGQGRDQLLRSLIVPADLKARGLGGRVLAAVEIVARDLDGERLHLLTTTAAPFFAQRGLVTTDRETAPLAIRQTREFADICPASAVYMTKDL